MNPGQEQNPRPPTEKGPSSEKEPRPERAEARPERGDPRVDDGRDYRPPYNKHRRRTYRPAQRGPPEEYPYRTSDGPDGGNGYFRGYRSYAPPMYQPNRYPSYRRDPRANYDPYPRRPHMRNDRSWGPHYNDYRPRAYYRRRPGAIDPVPVNILSIFGLDTKTTEEELKHWIAEKAEGIQSTKVDLILDKYTGYSKGYAFVYFNTVEDAAKVKETLTNQIFNGAAIRVDYSITPAGHKEEKKKDEEEGAGGKKPEESPQNDG
ncbi:transformer-2 protein [Nematocida major]|uniref:transformer-2 protein n=1 Tax=Nematocida major TaxID=1912982 RepID=UPI002008861C|nr:transformer-2 protein [Nematocida major]KAH9385934.1 transformer-2 protein [Nematocida major]